MFQTFSGNSRRPRQVNLSGQNTNPFLANAWSPSPSGTQQTVANAQQEREQRQRERERLNASKRIQRAWRGHTVRRDLADSRRKIWDGLNTDQQSSLEVGAGSVLAEQLHLIVTFYSQRRRDDLERLVHLSQRISYAGFETFLARPDIQTQLLRLANITLEALQASTPQCPPTLLQLLVAIINRKPESFPRISRAYYTFLSTLCTKTDVQNIDRSLVLTAIKIPLIQKVELDTMDDSVLDAYAAFALCFLTTPNLADILGGLDELAAVVNISLVSAALVRSFSSTSNTQVENDSRLWLLAHFISLHRLQQRNSQDPDFLRALSIQLSNSSAEIVGRIDATDPEVLPDSSDNEAQKDPIPPLPPFIKTELLSLVNKASITGLLNKFNIDYAKASAAGEEDASLLASYALTLLRIFPRSGDEIRMWLYLGSMTTSAGVQITAMKFFWQAMISTNIFALIRADSKAALTILRSQTERKSTLAFSSNVAQDREWRTVLLFLELYTFVLRFMDDEEFLSAPESQFGQAVEPVSRIRASALPIEDVKRLTIFLKNLAFTSYYHAGELSDEDQQGLDGGLGTYFGTPASNSRFQIQEPEENSKRTAPRPFAGIAGMTFNYVRTIVTGVMRMLYERDSRRKFLPKNHWLMTSRFDMEGFIPAVVMEEERQHEVREEGDDDDPEPEEEEDPFGSRRDVGLVGMSRPRRAVQIEQLRKQQQKAARQKVLAAVGPRLEILQNMPFTIPFETRVQIFRQFVLLDQTRRRDGVVDPDAWRMVIGNQSHMRRRASGHEFLGRHHAKIRRDQIFDDAYEQFYDLGEGLKEPIQITFVDQFDTAEAGIDGGGVTKEFLTSVTNESLRGEDGPNWFISNDQNLLYPNPAALDERKEWMRKVGLTESSSEWQDNIKEILRRYQFLGRIVGKCLYEGILIDVGFAGFFLLKWAASGAVGSESGYKASINDLRDLDESLYQGLLKLKNYPGNVEDFSLDFTITDTISMPGEPTETITRDLMPPNGANTAVTNENRILYSTYVARHRLQVQPHYQTQAFLKGLGEIIKPSWLSMFNQSELQTLVGGDSSQIDVEDLRRNTQYGGVYVIGDDGLEHDTVQLFWKVLKELDDSDRRKVLKYVTSTPRAPLLGFAQLNPRFSIRDAGSDEERLPSTSTCVNLLKLPRYSTATVLRDKLLYAVNSGAGFDLS
ncbi:putative E3 ubiquitin protein ligase [Lachnellula suecica]|uniref:HECT-type E3 ubiquitin transferase n=1 Tax=Lachnellula suecica TaxID=602035 RepID=A0A8T9C396_9HELO|nr:putative E3 ubiquitin protein ligase [Lachnellula suecica]